MKVFLVFLGLLMAGTLAVAHRGDMERYVRLQADLKALAEECAVGAALYYDEEAFGRGLLVIDRQEAEKYVASLVQAAGERFGATEGVSLTHTLEIEDDGSPGNVPGGPSPSVTVRLALALPDLFRLPFLNVRQIDRGAEYELADFRSECYNGSQ